MEYNFRELEQRWQQWWRTAGTYRVTEDASREKYYVLNMFPYPSGAGLHVGHPLGYIASDIFARYKRLCGYNVLNPMGYDAYGLPAEQYAIATGQHPETTTQQNIARYRDQLDRMGFSFDWDREVRTCDPSYYQWTQWAFLQMFHSFYCCKCGTVLPITDLVAHFEKYGMSHCYAYHTTPLSFTAAEWCAMSAGEQAEILMHFRMAFLASTTVNWCEALGTVLANDEVQDGVSVRGGYPVVQKTMRQWCLRVSAYAERLLTGLDDIAWSDAIKDTQRHWIGRSEGAEIEISVADSTEHFTIFTTRADTLFGVTFFVLAPESELVDKVVSASQRPAVDEYLAYVRGRSERQRMIDHTVTGVFTGAYGINPLTCERCPIYVAEYVLAGYGTGAIMAVPAHDSRDYAFAKHFSLPILPLIAGADVSSTSYDAKEGIMVNSPREGMPSYKNFSINGLSVHDAIAATKAFIAKEGLGQVKVNYRLRDAIFSRQRYWGEPIPIYYKDGIATPLPEECLPLLLPAVEQFLPTSAGEPPLGNARLWAWDEKNRKVVDKALIGDGSNGIYPLELNTMPGFAGSSAYFLRYMDPHNAAALVAKDKGSYWRNVDLYVGGAEHATGHLIYSRFWNKFLYDIGVSPSDEPFARLVNQGMIQGRSNFVYRIKGSNTFVSAGLREGYDTTEIHVDVNIVHNDILDIAAFRQWREEYQSAEFILEDGRYVCGWAVEKMSKSMYNVVNPDMIIDNYGADTLRLYEMFLGPVEQSKPWDTNGIDGCHRFLRKFWGLFFDKNGQWHVDDSTPSADSTRSLHRLIKKVSADIEAFSFNTAVSAFMIATTELAQQQCRSRSILEPLVILLAPFAPHIAEELYAQLGHSTTVCDASWPQWDDSVLVETTLTLPVQYNGKVRYTIAVAAAASDDEVRAAALTAPQAAKYLAGKEVVKVIIVPKKIVNIVVKG